MDSWIFPSSPPNLSDHLMYESFMQVNESDLHGNYTDHSFNRISTVVITCMYFLVCTVGLCGNALVIYVILRYAKMKTVTNIYILNLAVADVLFMLGLPFIAIQLALVHWPFGPVLCRVVMTVDSLNQFTSIFCLMVMSIDRYLAVVHPIKSTKWRKPRMAKTINLAVWGVSLMVNLPIVIYSGVITKHDGCFCTIVWPEPQEAYYTAFMFYTFILGFFLPLMVICLCYLFIIIKVKSSGIRVGSSKRKRSERKVTRMVSIVVAVFVFCWLPFYIFNVTSVTGTISTTPILRSTFAFVVVLGYANSCANPILYAFLSENFKKSFQNVLCLKKVGGLDEVERSDSRQDKSPASLNVLGGKTPRTTPVYTSHTVAMEKIYTDGFRARLWPHSARMRAIAFKNAIPNPKLTFNIQFINSKVPSAYDNNMSSIMTKLNAWSVETRAPWVRSGGELEEQTGSQRVSGRVLKPLEMDRDGDGERRGEERRGEERRGEGEGIKAEKRQPVWCQPRLKVYLRRQSVSVVDPDRWLSPLTVLPSPPGLRGQKGVDEPDSPSYSSSTGTAPLNKSSGEDTTSGSLTLGPQVKSTLINPAYVQRCDEELVGVLLLVACEVTCVSPHQVQQPEGNVGRTMARVELRAQRREQRGGGGEEERLRCTGTTFITSPNSSSSNDSTSTERGDVRCKKIHV
ncbi:hypothetical protein INR49_018121 [Caranx melampygus]|nr:hypothetical protein INR49_018121 [Caranx melampygus]